MSDELTLSDDYGDVLVVDSDYGLTIKIEDNARCGEWFVRDPREALDVADAIYAAADEILPQRKPHPDAVLASSVSYNEAVLRLAAAHDRTVEFSYSKGDGSVIERRRLQPESLREVKGHLTFTGFDPDRQDVRAYRLDRISGEVRL